MTRFSESSLKADFIASTASFMGRARRTSAADRKRSVRGSFMGAVF
jgi:hypothetical protein